MSLRILKASAGSGKTYSLTETYIRFCLDPKYGLDFTHILAITFTNKASAEMKDRIIGLLYTLSRSPSDYPGISNLKDDLQLSLEEIQIRSGLILNRILKEFNQFSITTIDSFFTRLYGSMTLDLFGDVPGEVTTDVEKALEYAADQLIAECQEDKALKEILLDILDENIRKGLGVGLKRSLTRLGMELFNDEFLRLRTKSNYIEPIKDLHQAISHKVDLFELEFENYRNELKHLLKSGGLDHKDFFRGFTKSILDKESMDDLIKLKSFERIADQDKWFTTKEQDLMMVKVSPIADELLELGKRFFDYVKQHAQQYSTYTIVLRNYGAFRVLRFLYQSMQDYLKTHRLNLLSEINFKINQHLTMEDSMVIYEKIGQRIRAVMIDEFQDTSQIQWDNLVPLIQNNMAEGFPNLVVGDVKQAIYRFRNGRWEIMEIQVPEFKKPWLAPGENLFDHLEYNWRSYPEIVHFNNNFFTGVAANVSFRLRDYISGYTMDSQSGITPDQINELVKLANAAELVYKNASQRVPEKNLDKNGFVDLTCHFYPRKPDKSELERLRFSWLKEKLIDLFEDGFEGENIGILARGKKELGILARYLTLWSEEDRRFQYTSEDSLILDLSDGVQLLIAALRWKVNIDPDLNRMVYLNYLTKLNLSSSGETNWKYSLPPSESGIQQNAELGKIQDSGIDRLTTFFESTVEATGLASVSGQWPYLLCFLEEVKKFEMQHGSDIPLFLQEWNDKIRKVQIQLSDDRGKMRLFTIHKSKGLEFEVVLLPFADWDFEISQSETILWVENQDDEILKMAGPLPINYSSRLLGTFFDYAFFGEYLRNVMDNLNLLYVAMTRPIQRMHIYLQAPETPSGQKSEDFPKPLRNTRELFLIKYPELKNGPVHLGMKIQKEGSSDIEKDISSIKLKTYPIRKKPLPLQLKPSFDGSEIESIGRGLIIHEILEHVRTFRDIPTAVSRAVLAGLIRSHDQPEWIEILRQITEYEPVREFFSGEWAVHNEQSIMVPGGGEYRPDRVQENGQRYVVLDYKTGEPSARHEVQIKNYKSIITSMVSLPVQVYLYYPFIPKLVEVH